MLTSFPKCNRDHSQARALGGERQQPHHAAPAPRETRILCDTQELASVGVEARTLALGWDADPGDPLLALAVTDLPTGKHTGPSGFWQTTPLDHRTVVALYLQEAQRGPAGCPAPQEAQGPGSAWGAGLLRANTLPGPLLSHFPTEERGSSQRPGGHFQSPWTWSQWPW